MSDLRKLAESLLHEHEKTVQEVAQDAIEWARHYDWAQKLKRQRRALAAARRSRPAASHHNPPGPSA